MEPAPGARLLRYVGDRLRIAVRVPGAGDGWQVRLRTNLGRAAAMRHEVIGHLGAKTLAGASWRDIVLPRRKGEYVIDLPLCEVGWFRAKAYAIDPQGGQHWPAGDDLGIAVHPDRYRGGNAIYCAFPRLFGQTRALASAANPLLEAQLKALDLNGYTVIPPSGTLRDLTAALPHVVDALNCRILHLLPVTPAPTTYARMGRFGSPYAAQDLTMIDPALVVFDRRTTGVDQFRELTYAARLKGARVFLDIAINHTGWGSRLHERYPEWFERDADGAFHSPGAWGNTWEDLVELDHGIVELWQELGDAFLTWCRRGVDGFRCDAGYMVPPPAWRYIVARVREEFPDTVFLLEGLGGAWGATADLMTDGGMQWAYSELFQNHTPGEIASYLDHCYEQGKRLGVLVHYSETHDNDRLAKQGDAWSLLRNRLCALTSQSGAFGFTCGVEWLAREKIDVHRATGLHWGADDNLVGELNQLNRLLADHPAFFDGAELERLSAEDDRVYALKRTAADGLDHVLVLCNTDLAKAGRFVLPAPEWAELGKPAIDLLGQPIPVTSERASVVFTLPPGACCCMAGERVPQSLAGDAYRRARAQSAWGYQALAAALPIEDLGPCDWRELAALVDASPLRFLAAVSALDPAAARVDCKRALDQAALLDDLPRVTPWNLRDLARIALVPAGHWLLVRDVSPFSARLETSATATPRTMQSIPCAEGHVAAFAPSAVAADAVLTLDRYVASEGREVSGQVRFLGEVRLEPASPADGLALLTNGRGGMARMAVDLGQIRSKYDCLLGANLHPEVPSDRHVLAKRVRAWVVADGFISPLDREALASFTNDGPAHWRFIAGAGDGRTVAIDLTAAMLPGRNTVALRFARVGTQGRGRALPPDAAVSITVRIDIEDRSFHGETRRDAGSELHLAGNTAALADAIGFGFTPAPDRRLRVTADRGTYHDHGEWALDIAHPIEASRGQTGSGDAYSPGWFALPLAVGDEATLTVDAEAEPPVSGMVAEALDDDARSGADLDDPFGAALARALPAYVVRRGRGATVIAGYPWFLDWGRDSFISARGLLAAGMVDEVARLLAVFGRFEDRGTLPNCLNGEDASNRETSDAPLWFGVVCEELAAIEGARAYDRPIDGGGRTLREVLVSIAEHYRSGAANGVAMDPFTGLVWSPRHFTWMDTNYPAGTPREGYPVEIQALWIRLLRQLERIGAASSGEAWSDLAAKAEKALGELYWLEDRGYLADLLLAPANLSANAAVTDHALRPNMLFAVAFGQLPAARARRCVAAASRYLVVPGAIRSLAPIPSQPTLAIYAGDGRLLNDPQNPYWGRYEGDEDTRRKPAYHNGTAWTWPFPTFCEALAVAWNHAPHAVAAARAYLSSMDRLLADGCAGHPPESVDGDAPHRQRGCDAQAWGATEALRVWKLLQDKS
ncbi:MAG: glycogen debranching enzyme N-terminal domain-containing protein [Planctomycetes bacterium]|nr:glycogen debranching enzyme N-terminal domain-containing protein [Planctomycetota bacterium]